VLDILFADDSKQEKPMRPGMGPLIAIGYIYVPGENVKPLEVGLESICNNTGFPPGLKGEFKWSPGRELWMHSNLIGEKRTDFFMEVIGETINNQVSAAIIVADTSYQKANPDAEDNVEDVTRLLLERANSQLSNKGHAGIIVVDRPSGGRSNEDKFLQNCLETITLGTRYVRPDQLAINVLSTPSKLVRCLQMADLITSASLAFISGEKTYSPRIFEVIKSFLNHDAERIGGIGVKIHPDFRYVNLYHWLLGDSYFWKHSTRTTLPILTYPYAKGPLDP